jgi:menaquinone-specific isochorismate synthase
MTSRAETTNFESIAYHYGRLVSDSLPCPDVTLIDFLAQSTGQARFYWENSRDAVAFAGAGKAIALIGWRDNRFETIRHHAAELFAGAINFNPAEPLAAPRLFGGFAFHPDFVPDNTWADFTPAHFVLPHYQLLSINGETWLTINANVPYGENPLELRDLRYPMPYTTWESTIHDATERMKNGDLNKVVLSRVAEAQFARRVDVLAPLQYLAGAYPETYRFLFEARPYHAFYGATPEILVSVAGDQVETMALAGSIQRGATPAEDDTFADALLHSEKDRYEHQLVIDKIRDRLTPLTTDLTIGETEIMRLSNIQHIHTAINGRLKTNDGVLPLVEALHPTPALGGDPREVALSLISDYEPVPRGWYAAPIGWIDGDMDGQFGVAIRSAVAEDRRVWMYAGAGIVAASDPRKEWDETGLKFRPMLNALGIDTRQT